MSKPSGLRALKLDASGEGCTGMFWRTRPEMGATSSRSDWPRNGASLVGVWEAHGGAAWARVTRAADGSALDPPLYLPEVQKGVNILFDMGAAE
jgi:hypothetical protein